MKESATRQRSPMNSTIFLPRLERTKDLDRVNGSLHWRRAQQLLGSGPDHRGGNCQSVLPDFYGGDHAPVKLSDTRAPTSPSRRTRWILTKADWERFKSIVSTCDSDIPTDVNKALRKLRSVYGRPPTSHILGLKHLGLVTTDQLEMANILSSSFAEVSITSSYTENFETVKTAEEARPVDLNINNISPLNLPFSMVEIQTALASSSFELMYRTR
ncbi:hypothetical protein J6590_075031 [Homalodisca vitripennis]|nr:hypothetical protein J6590_075031 [Homalodisca vitripennis]